MGAPAPDSRSYLEDLVGDADPNKRPLKALEPDEFQRVLRRRREFKFDRAVESEPESMISIVDR
eukprot:5041724-Pyramimonas_sp.AAC.1